MPKSFAPPHPKQLFAAFGASTSFSPMSSDQSDPAALSPPHATLPFFHFDPQQIRQCYHAARQFLLVQIRKTQPKCIRQMRLHVKIAPWSKQQSPLLGV